MKFKLDFTIPPFDFKINHKDKIALIGSCFSDEMKIHFENGGFTLISNPFGTLFHPIAIANVINSTLSSDVNVDFYERDKLFFSWDASSKIAGESRESLIESVRSQRSVFKTFLKEAKVLVVTFGTAFEYNHKELNQVVGNCHKAPASLFDKNLTDLNILQNTWKELIQNLLSFNENLQIILTVSPVRHKKDGLVENNRSKARCLELVHGLLNDNVTYFPSYEILIDELRDYQFYATDFVHPAPLAIEYIWEKLKMNLISEEAVTLSDQVFKLKTAMQHRSLFPNSEADKNRIIQLNEKKRSLTQEFPEINWH